jgi:hypothetical protein
VLPPPPPSEANIKAFAADIESGKAEPEYKSAAIPEEPLDGGVTVVVGKNFDAIVKDKTKDVLLEVGVGGGGVVVVGWGV